MFKIIGEHISQHHLRALLYEFVEYQSIENDGFPFGELLVLHYNMLSEFEKKEIYTVAAAIEILILSYDILDDIEDDDCKGKPWLTETQDSSLVLNATTA